MQFRLDTFNTFNHTQFHDIGTSYGAFELWPGHRYLRPAGH